MQKWEETGVRPSNIKLWNLHDIYDPSQTIYFDVAAILLEDSQRNLSDYLSNDKNILIDSWY